MPLPIATDDHQTRNAAYLVAGGAARIIQERDLDPEGLSALLGELVADRPHDVHATIAVAERTPVRSDTRVSLEFQGLTGVPVVSLEGGDSAAAPPVSGPLIAEKGAGQSMPQAARDALRRVDTVLSDNAAPLHEAIGNIGTFARR